MNIPVLKVEPRQQAGKEHARKLRQSGQIPGVCYGRAKDPIALSLDPEALTDILRGPRGLNSLIKLDGAENRTVFVQDLQRHPVERDIIHVDFIFVDPEQRVYRRVPVEFVGKPEGVKVGGVLQIARRDILVESLPADIPDKVVVDVAPMEIGDVVHVEEIGLPQGVDAIFDHNYTICAVVSPSEEKEPEAEAEAAEGEEQAAEGAAEGEEQAGAAKDAGEKKDDKQSGE